MDYHPPDGWPLPKVIIWYKCQSCGMFYGDGDFNQASLAEYYKKYYGFGVNTSGVKSRLETMAVEISAKYPQSARVVDFGGGGDDGQSIFLNKLKQMGYTNLHNVNVNEPIPPCDILLASHVMEHIYNVKEIMRAITKAVDTDGVIIVDGPDATGMLLHCKAPMLDYHAKHINHFRLLDYVTLMARWGFELVDLVQYYDTRSDTTHPCDRMWFRRLNVADMTAQYIEDNMYQIERKLSEIKHPVNVWGLGDIAQHILTKVNLDVLDYIDIDPAMIGATYNGKPIMQTVANDAPIVIVAQGQRNGLIDYIKSLGVKNRIITI